MSQRYGSATKCHGFATLQTWIGYPSSGRGLDGARHSPDYIRRDETISVRAGGRALFAAGKALQTPPGAFPAASGALSGVLSASSGALSGFLSASSGALSAAVWLTRVQRLTFSVLFWPVS
jgi:hypothetical protein